MFHLPSLYCSNNSIVGHDFISSNSEKMARVLRIFLFFILLFVLPFLASFLQTVALNLMTLATLTLLHRCNFAVLFKIWKYSYVSIKIKLRLSRAIWEQQLESDHHCYWKLKGLNSFSKFVRGMPSKYAALIQLQIKTSREASVSYPGTRWSEGKSGKG